MAQSGMEIHIAINKKLQPPALFHAITAKIRHEEII